MFEKMILRRGEDGGGATLGEIAEGLLFYQRVHLILDRPVVTNLVEKIGMDQLLALLNRPGVSAVYCREMLGTMTQQVGALTHHSFVGMEMTGQTSKPDRVQTPLEVVHQILKATNSYSGRQARKLAEIFFEKVPVRSLMSKDFLIQGKGLADAATDDVYDLNFLHEAFSRTLQASEGFAGFKTRLSLEVQPTQLGFTVFSNLDLAETNLIRSRRVPALGELTQAYLLNEILMARSDLMLASHYGSDFKTSNVGSEILDLRYGELMKRSGIHETQLNEFQTVVVNQGRSLKEVIDHGERSFTEFLALLDKATLFKNWSSGVHPDSSMVAEYLKEAANQGWIGSLPAKVLRYVIGGVIDAKLPGASKAFGVADAFLIDKFMKGWRPNHFVEKRLKPFVNS